MYEAQYKNVYGILACVLSFAMAYDKANADHKLDVSDIQFVLPPLLKLPAAIAAASSVKSEYLALAPEAKAELEQKLADEFSLANHELELKVEAGIDWLMDTGKFVGALTTKQA